MRKLKLQELNRPSVETFKKQTKTAVVLVLDNIRSRLNVGSAFRTGDAFAVEHLYLCGITATPPHREILKTAIGATDSVDWTHTESTVSALEKLKAEGYTILAVEQTDNSTLLQDYPIDKQGKYALVFGNEVKGVSEAALTLVDGAIEVPQFGTKHSLNVSVCLGVVLWEFTKGLKL